jgi:hypothetical protein
MLGEEIDKPLDISQYISKIHLHAFRAELLFLRKKTATWLRNDRHMLKLRKLQSASQIWRMGSGEAYG